jgi:hypothetical protein
MNDVVAKQLAELSIRAQGALQQGAIAGQIAQAQIAQRTDVFNNVTLPNFKLRQGQYQREVMGLQIRTASSIYEATRPYRLTEYWDPPKPIPGLEPDYYAPTAVYNPGPSFLQNVTAGIGAVNQFNPEFFSSLLNRPNTNDIYRPGGIASNAFASAGAIGNAGFNINAPNLGFGSYTGNSFSGLDFNNVGGGLQF